MIEQSMIFALGFLVALLLVLLFLPAFWNRAIRLSLRKIGERLPVSMAEVAAERDGLRAEVAITQRRLEQARDRAVAARDKERCHVGRLTTQLSALEIELEARRLDVSARDVSLLEARHMLLATEAELGTMRKDHYDAGALIERAARDADSMRTEQLRLRDVADQRRMTIASLETRLQGMQARIDALEASIRDAPSFGSLDPGGFGYRGAALSFETERLLVTLADPEGTQRAEAARYAELEGRLRQLEAEKATMERELGAARTVLAAGRIDPEEIALVRRSIAEVAAEVVRLGGLREAAAEAPNVLQIRRGVGRDPVARDSFGRDTLSKAPASEAAQGKSVGAT